MDKDPFIRTSTISFNAMIPAFLTLTIISALGQHAISLTGTIGFTIIICLF